MSPNAPPSHVPVLPPVRASLPKLTDRLTLGTEGLRVSPFCLGRVLDRRTVPAAFDAGINFFFVSADMHWPIYEEIRRGLTMLLERPGVRDQITVGVVSYVTQRVFCHVPFNEVIDAIPRLDRIDLTIVGGAYGSEVLERIDEYRVHRLPGGIVPQTRATGVSFHDRRAAAQITRGGLVDIAFCRYNAFHRGAEDDLFPHVQNRARPTLLFNFLSTQGFLRERDYDLLQISKQHWRPKATDYYRFVLARPEIDGILGAPDTPEHIEDLSRALEEGPLTEEEYTYLRDLADLARGDATLADPAPVGVP